MNRSTVQLGSHQTPSGGLRPARRSTLAGDVYEAIKALIMDHVIAPGAKVNIDALARDLDVSPTPVREALARLESDGLVTKRPLSGYNTTSLLTRVEFEELFEMRLLLEPTAAGWASERASEAQRTAIVSEAETVSITDPGGYKGFAAFSAQDARFHHLIAASSGNLMMYEAITRLHSHLHLHRLYFPAQQSGGTVGEHVTIANAIAAGDVRKARAAMRDHLLAARLRHAEVFVTPSHESSGH